MMDDSRKKINIPRSLVQAQFEPQTELIKVTPKRGKMAIGIPRESTLQENRVPLVPSAVRILVAHEHRVIIEAGAGTKAHFSDHEYSEAGAEIVHDPRQVYDAGLILKVAPPTLDEIEFMRPNQILISPIHLPMLTAEYLNKLRQKRVFALAMEYICDESGSFPIVRAMSELAGLSAVLTAADLLTIDGGGRGVLLGGISGVPPAKVLILGAGVVAEYATRTALGLGAEVRIFDNNIYKLKRLQHNLGILLHTSTYNTIHLREELTTADVVIGAIHSKSGRTPIIVNEDMVMSMKPGSVIIDVSIDQGGCFATSRVTNHDAPTFITHDVIHYCVPNIASKVPRTASQSVSNIITSILLKAADADSVENLLIENHELRNGVYTYKGCLTNNYLSSRFQIKHTDLDLLITSGL